METTNDIQVVRLRIIAAAAAAGGLITHGQLHDALPDVDYDVREKAIQSLNESGELETNSGASFHSLVRPSGWVEAPDGTGRVAPGADRPRVLTTQLTDRLDAIGCQIGQAIEEACALRIPHEHIESLLFAYRAITATRHGLPS